MVEKTPAPASEPEDLDEAPPLTAEDFARAVHRVGLKPVGIEGGVRARLGGGFVDLSQCVAE
ncbi:MAG: hypothetical protein FWD62_05420 [Betaproteobacteria bacterium]|nr:hypothetical protein [Betaproteobacteria bacterium]